MSERDVAAIDADDLAMLATSFEAAMLASPGPAEADAALFGLGWGELVSAEPTRGAAVAFTALGATGAASGLLDDVVAGALGLDVSCDACVVVPAPEGTAPPGRRDGDSVVVDGIVSARARVASTVLLPTLVDGDVRLATASTDVLATPSRTTLDPGGSFRRVKLAIPASSIDRDASTDAWSAAVAAARVALAHQLVAEARAMLDLARRHALDRVQFGRPVSTFQAVRHRLAESLVQIEGAAAVAAVCTDDADPLLAALAKSLAGNAARSTARHAQQVLAGIGFTTDHPFQLRLKRVLTLDVLFGSASSLPTGIGAELLARGNAPRLVEL